MTFFIFFSLSEEDCEWCVRFQELGIRGNWAQYQAASVLSKFNERARLYNEPVLGQPKATRRFHTNETIPDGCESTIMLIRHCEKGHLKSHCNYVGYERSMYLATQFGTRWPVPQSPLYALKVKRRHKENFREVETVHAIADKFHLDINKDYRSTDKKALVDRVLHSVLSGKSCGKLTVISWQHSDIPKLARRLGM